MRLIEYLNKAQSPYHVIDNLMENLEEAGFKRTEANALANLKSGAYYINIFDTSLVAFRLIEKASGIHIAASHTDYPCFKFKPEPDMDGGASKCKKINVEPYGGMLKRTWFDRPLGMAGSVWTKSSDPYDPAKSLICIDRPLFVIPSLAPHMDREIEKRELDPQKELLPVFGLKGDASHDSVMDIIAEEISVDKDEILSFDINLFLCNQPVSTGYDNEFIMAQGIDNMASVAALAEAIVSNDYRDYLPIACFFNNEEIGSQTKQGADSALLENIVNSLMKNPLCSSIQQDNSFIVSADGAHAIHPNYPEKSDPTSGIKLGGGMVIKTSASQRYATDAKMTAIIKSLCQENDIRAQVQANKSGAPGGSTLGPMMSSRLPMMAADVGIPMLGMHSIYETACQRDYEDFAKFIRVFL